MIDNKVRFQRFFGTDPNIAQHGSIAAEWGVQKPDPDPIASPMANTRVSDVQLALVRGGSDRTRLGSPARPEANPYTGPQMTLVLSRNAVMKLGTGALSGLRDAVSALQSPNQKLQEVSLQRVEGMRSLVDGVNQWAGQIQVRSLAGHRP